MWKGRLPPKSAINWAGSCCLIGSNYVSSTSRLYWLGILLIYAGIALRFYAIEVPGCYFTTTGMASIPTGDLNLLYVVY